MQKNLVDWKSRCNFAACLTLNNKKRRNERREDIYKKERGEEACKYIRRERSHGIYGVAIRQRQRISEENSPHCIEVES